MVASEVLPYAKTGGLADVAAALPAALAAARAPGRGGDAALPRRRRCRASLLTTFVLDIGRRAPARADLPRADGGRRRAVAGRHSGPLRSRRPLRRRQPRLSRQPAPLRGAGARRVRGARIVTGFSPDVVHAHDWQGGLAPVYLRTRYATHPCSAACRRSSRSTTSPIRALFEPDWLPRLDLGWDLFTPQRLEFWGRVSLLKGGHQLQRDDHDGQPALRRGDPDAGVRLRARRRAGARAAPIWSASSTASTPTVGPGARSVPAGAVRRRRRSTGKRAAKRAVLARYGLPADDGGAGAAAHRHGLADGAIRKGST